MNAIASGDAGGKKRWVDVMSPIDIRFWAGELRCSEGQLLDAVSYVGFKVEDLRRHLASHKVKVEPRLD